MTVRHELAQPNCEFDVTVNAASRAGVYFPARSLTGGKGEDQMHSGPQNEYGTAGYSTPPAQAMGDARALPQAQAGHGIIS
jgi:hypothetical protein